MRYIQLTFCIWIVFVCVISGRLYGSTFDKSQQPADKTKTARFIYKQNPNKTLTVYYPDNWKPADRRSALVIFRCRIPYQREYFRKRGMVIIKPLLAAVNSGQLPKKSLAEIAKLPKPRNQVEDTKSVIRYLRQNADQLGIDPQKIVATGTSGGGDLALQSHLNRNFESKSDDLAISPSPNVLVLYCPAFDGINIWYVKMKTLLQRIRSEAPSYLPHLKKFIRNTTDEYATPVDHRKNMIELAAELGKAQGFTEEEVKKFQDILLLFNQRDWQLLHPFEEALKMSASRLLTKEPLPPTLIMFGDRDHLYEHQQAFVKHARKIGQKFELKIYQGAGHSFMTQPAFEKPSTRVAEHFLIKHGILPRNE